MNERIKLLAEQAGYRDIFDNDTKARARLEKYTQLIMRECAEYIGNKGMLAGGGCTVVGEEILMIADGFRKHFGVEE